jgi:hypothetical protein
MSVRCPLYPQKRTSELSRGMSALCQKQTFCTTAERLLFDHLVGAQQERLRDLQAKRLRGLEIDGELELSGPRCQRNDSLAYRIGAVVHHSEPCCSVRLGHLQLFTIFAATGWGLLQSPSSVQT